MNSKKMKVAVIGLGRFGYFWAELLESRFDVIAWSRSPSRGVPTGVKKVSFEELFEAEAIFLCNSISSMKDVASQLTPYLKKSRLVIIDTCSVKTYPLKILKEKLPEGQSIIGTHPMIGPDSACSGVKDKPLVLTAVRQSKKDFLFWDEQFRAMGFNVVKMSAEEHDREAAYTQGITHFVGRVLSEMNLKSSKIATSGYESLQDIILQTCHDSWQLFEDLQSYNPYTNLMRKDLNQALDLMLKKFDCIQNHKDCEAEGDK